MNKRLEVLLKALEKNDEVSIEDWSVAHSDFEKHVEQLFILNYFLKLRPSIKKTVQTNYLNFENIESLVWEEFDVSDDGLVNDSYYKEDLEQLVSEYISKIVADIENQTLKLWE